MSATLTDIARETNTSISTVSRVLSGGTTAARISEATRAKVTEVAKRMGYRPNLVARSLRTRKSNTVALLVSDIANPWFGQMASLIEQSLHGRGYSLMLCNSGEDAEREEEYLRLLPAKGIDGLIVVPVARTKKHLLELVPEGLPLVVLDRPIPGINATVSSDQDQASNILCDALARAGVKSIAIVCGPQHIPTHRRRCEVAVSRFKVLDTHEGPAQRETGRQAFIRFLGIRPDAIVCTNNFLAQGVIDSMARQDTHTIIGVFDEIPMMDLIPLPILASVQDVPAMAEAAVNLLMPLLADRNAVVQPVVLEARAVANQAFADRVRSK